MNHFNWLKIRVPFSCIPRGIHIVKRDLSKHPFFKNSHLWPAWVCNCVPPKILPARNSSLVPSSLNSCKCKATRIFSAYTYRRRIQLLRVAVWISRLSTPLFYQIFQHLSEVYQSNRKWTKQIHVEGNVETLKLEEILLKAFKTVTHNFPERVGL